MRHSALILLILMYSFCSCSNEEQMVKDFIASKEQEKPEEIDPKVLQRIIQNNEKFIRVNICELFCSMQNWHKQEHGHYALNEEALIAFMRTHDAVEEDDEEVFSKTWDFSGIIDGIDAVYTLTYTYAKDSYKVEAVPSDERFSSIICDQTTVIQE